MTRLEYRADPQAELADRLPRQLRSPAPGDYVTFELGPRQRDRAARARAARSARFHNVCRHRGARLLEGTGHCPGASPAPTTAGPTATTASCSACPRARAFPDLDRAQLRPRSRCASEITLGFVFVCLAGDPPPPPSQAVGAVRRGVRALPLRGDGAARSRCTSRTGSATGRSRWTTTWSPITCRSDIRD